MSNENIVFKKINLKEAENENNEYMTLEGSNNISVSERIYNKGGNKILNSETEPIMKKIKINEEIGNKNENEYIFPENLNLDNLSYNDAFIENNRKKNDE
jgi:hypothetical protein